MPHNSTDRLILDRIRTIIADLNHTPRYGNREALIQRHLVVLYMVNIHPLFMDGFETNEDEDDDLHYYSAPTLLKAVKATANGPCLLLWMNLVSNLRICFTIKKRTDSFVFLMLPIRKQ